MDDDDGPIPTQGSYKGIALESEQSPQRLVVVRGEIDVVLAMVDPLALMAWAADSMRAPESRLLAAAMCEAMWAEAAETRVNRPPGISLEALRAATAGLNSRRWRCPWTHASLLDPAGGVVRETPLVEE
jgi:hypothetical protein